VPVVMKAGQKEAEIYKVDRVSEAEEGGVWGVL
jgi:hypothetical protein